MSDFTHLNGEGSPVMVDVGSKNTTTRRAEARGEVRLGREVTQMILERRNRKGDVLHIAELAGIMACKQTPALIPLCHTVRLDSVAVACELDAAEQCIKISSVVTARDVTGVEMEALTGVSVAALTVYDMCKAIDKSMRIENIRLVAKSGGASGVFGSEDS